MIEIIPNWHPIFVHFTLGIFSAAFGFFLVSYFLSFLPVLKNLAYELEITARWCLWVVAFITIGTVLVGLYAYNTVVHDSVSHVAMTNHRNWALPTAAAIILMAIWSFWRYVKQQKLSLGFIIALVVVELLLLSTAWRGAELVFRYGLGVISLPQPGEMDHHHHHD